MARDSRDGGEQGELTLDDGTEVPVRGLRPEDAERLKEFYDRMSERTFFLRFFEPRHEA